VARRVIDQGPFRLTEIHGRRRSLDQRFEVGRLLRRHGLQPARCEFALEETPLLDLIESLFVEAHDRGDAAFDYEACRATVARAVGLPERTERA
jgi:hypothetical protein